MEKLSVKTIFRDFKTYLDKEITINGWIRTVRSSKAFGFIELNDGSFFKNIQVVFEENLSNFNDIAKLNVGSSLEVKGVLIESQGAKQPFEIKATEINVVGESTPDYPLQKKRHSFEYLRTIAHLHFDLVLIFLRYH